MTMISERLSRGETGFVQRRSKRSSSGASRKTIQTSRSGPHSRTVSIHDQITPPPTPSSSRSNSLMQSHSSSSLDGQLLSTQTDGDSAAATFLRAFYAFHPTPSTDSNTVTLTLNVGDVVLIHNVHVNGWADGTMLGSGARGWLPTNYCEEYKMAQMTMLLRACVNLLETCRGAVAEGFMRTSQGVVGDVVNGVKHLLDSTGCLTRDTVNVKSNESVRKSRKLLLSELSKLVNFAKDLPEDASMIGLAPEVEEALDILILGTFKVVTYGVRFLDAWCDEHEPFEEEEEDVLFEAMDVDQEGAPANAPNTPPTEFSEAASFNMPIIVQDTDMTPQAVNKIVTQTIDHHSQFLHGDISPSYLLTPASSTFPNSESYPYAGSSYHASTTSLGTQPDPTNALARLNWTHDVLLSYLGVYIGALHLQSRSAAQVLVTTRDTVSAAKDLLDVISCIYLKDPRAFVLEDAKVAMFTRINFLIGAARNSVKADENGETSEFISKQHGEALMEAAISCVRAAGDCVAKASAVLDNIGDFELQWPMIPTEGEPQLAIPEVPEPEYITVPSMLLTPLTPGGLLVPKAEPRTSCFLDMESVAASSDRGSTLIIQVPSPLVSEFAAIPELTELSSATDAENSDTFAARYKRSFTDSIATNTTTSTRNRDSNSTLISSSASSRPVSFDQTPMVSPKLTLDTFVPPSIFQEDVSVPATPAEERDNPFLEKSFSHELLFNKDGVVTGGTLPALVERLTMPDSTADATFASAFYLTFRLFTSPIELAQALVDRFDHVSSNLRGSTPVRLRVYNVFKVWLETHWKKEVDDEALDLIKDFASEKLKLLLPGPGDRLRELAERVTESDATIVPKHPVTLGQSKTAIAQDVTIGAPNPLVSKAQLALLRTSLGAPQTASILDFDPTEIARQLTLKESRLFCSITPDELLAQEWSKKLESKAVNVRGLSSLSTDLAHLVAISILHDGDAKKRAAVIKQWIKIADRCLELANYDSLMAILCSLNTSTIIRLKKTWELVSSKTKAALEHLRSVIDVAKNYGVLRARLRNHVPPCLPFLGTYLTDLTFIDDGNPSKRPLSSDDPSQPQAINFDKHVKTARIISELQRFQVPYKIQEVPEMQQWIDAQIKRVQSSEVTDVQTLYRRSLLLEPREVAQQRPAPINTKPEPIVPTVAVNSGALEKKFELFGWAHAIKEKSSIASFNTFGSSSTST